MEPTNIKIVEGIRFFFFLFFVQTSGQRTKREEDGYHSCSHYCRMRRHCGKRPATFSTAYVLYCTIYRDATGLFCNELLTALFLLEMSGMSMIPNRSLLAEIHRRCRFNPVSSSTDCSRRFDMYMSLAFSCDLENIAHLM
jgi:hypothetical protein